MRITIIPSDKTVIIGDQIRNFDFTTDSNYHAIHWDGEKGFIETKVGDNIKLSNMDEFAEIIQQHAAILAQERALETSPEFIQQRLLTALSFYTFEKINGGITVDGLFIATGEADRGLINGAVTRAILDDNNTLSYAYYPTGGDKTTLTNAQFKTIGMAISRHVQKCLDAADVVESSIASYQTIQQVKAAFDAAYAA